MPHRIAHDDLRALEERLKGRTLESIGEDWGVSRERARQIVSAAFRRLVRANYRWQASEHRCASMANRLRQLEAALKLPPQGDPSPDSPIEELELRMSSYVQLKSSGLHRVADLARLTESDLKTFGLRGNSLTDLRFRLLRYGVSLAREGPGGSAPAAPEAPRSGS